MMISETEEQKMKRIRAREARLTAQDIENKQRAEQERLKAEKKKQKEEKRALRLAKKKEEEEDKQRLPSSSEEEDDGSMDILRELVREKKEAEREAERERQYQEDEARAKKMQAARTAGNKELLGTAHYLKLLEEKRKVDASLASAQEDLSKKVLKKFKPKDDVSHVKLRFSLGQYILSKSHPEDKNVDTKMFVREIWHCHKGRKYPYLVSDKKGNVVYRVPFDSVEYIRSDPNAKDGNIVDVSKIQSLEELKAR